MLETCVIALSAADNSFSHSDDIPFTDGKTSAPRRFQQTVANQVYDIIALLENGSHYPPGDNSCVFHGLKSTFPY
jgi:hypothetical protein